MTKRKASILLLIITAMPLLFASEKITLEEAKALAKENNKTIQIAKLDLESSMRSASVISLLPSLSLTGSITGSASLIDNTASIGSTSSPALNAGISFSLDSSDIYNGKTNSLAKESANLTYEKSENSTVNSVSTAYWNVVSASLAEKSAKENYESAKENYESAKAAYEGGKSTTLVLSQSELSLYDAEISYQSAQNTRSNAYDTLSYLVGIVDYTVDEELPEIGTMKDLDMIKGLVSSSLTYRSGLLAIDQADLSRKLLMATTVFPTFSLSASYRHYYNFSDSTTTSYQDSYKDSASLTLGVSIPLDHFIPRTKANVDLKNASSSIDRANLSLSQIEENLLNTVTTQYKAITIAKDNVEMYTKHLALAKNKLDLTQAAYDGGRATYETLATARTSYYTSEISLLQQRLNHITALSTLANTLGVEANTLYI